MTKMKKLYNLLILLVTVLFITNYVSGQDYDFVQDELGMVVMEAENYSEVVSRGDVTETTGSTWVEDTSMIPELFSGEGFMRAHNPEAAHGDIDEAITNAGYLGFNINFEYPGTYYIWARASRTGGSDDSFHAVLANGDIILDKVPMIAFEELMYDKDVNVWVWTYYSSAEPKGAASVDVPAAGVFSFRVYIRERNYKIDKIVLSMDMGYTPDPDSDTANTGPAETIYTGLVSHTANNTLLQVYPNPVTSSAMISYDLDKPEHVSIRVFNVLGEEVSTLSNEMQKAGRHEIRWNAADLSGSRLRDGLYFVKIKAGTETSTVKTMLAR